MRGGRKTRGSVSKRCKECDECIKFQEQCCDGVCEGQQCPDESSGEQKEEEE